MAHAINFKCCDVDLFQLIFNSFDFHLIFSVANISCDRIRNTTSTNATNGIYFIRARDGTMYPVYCDMVLGGGGWTLVATIHENDSPPYGGRCTPGDKWSSEHGNQYLSQTGAEAWFNKDIFGNLSSATSADYKSSAYFDLQARDVMIWQVPNKAPLEIFDSEAYLKYRTTNGFLKQYGGNMFYLYKDFYPIVSRIYTPGVANGPAIPVIFDKGDAAEVVSHFGTITQPNIRGGYIQVY